MLTRRAKTYSSFCSQTVNLSPAISSQFILGLCEAAEDRKNQKKNFFFLEVQGLSKSSMLIRLKSSSLVLVVTGSMPMPVCNRFHERLANNGKITTCTLTATPYFDAFVHRFPWTCKIVTWIIGVYFQCWKCFLHIFHIYLNIVFDTIRS